MAALWFLRGAGGFIFGAPGDSEEPGGRWRPCGSSEGASAGEEGGGDGFEAGGAAGLDQDGVARRQRGDGGDRVVDRREAVEVGGGGDQLQAERRGEGG